MSHFHEKLDRSAFQSGDVPPKFISYRAQRDATTFLQQTYRYERGLGLFYGPPLSGKTTALKHFIDRLPANAAAGIVNGAGLDAPLFLHAIAQAFGLDTRSTSLNASLNLLKSFAVRHTTTRHAPLLVIENLDKMTPSTIHIVCQLALLKVQSQSAFRLILVSNGPLDRMIGAPALQAIGLRRTGEHALGAMTRAETAYYLDAKLRQAGIERPETVFSPEVSDELYDESHGRPGLIDQCVLKRLSAAECLPVTADHTDDDIEEGAKLLPFEMVEESGWNSEVGDMPRLVITMFGKTIGTIALTERKILIGRSDHNDVVIDSAFVSRHHAILVRDMGATILSDLNSTNGTFVNSKRVFVHGLRHDDVISLGNHGIKLHDPGCRRRVIVDDAALADTVTMKALRDIRRRYARENVQLSRATSRRS